MLPKNNFKSPFPIPRIAPVRGIPFFYDHSEDSPHQTPKLEDVPNAGIHSKEDHGPMKVKEGESNYFLFSQTFKYSIFLK